MSSKFTVRVKSSFSQNGHQSRSAGYSNSASLTMRTTASPGPSEMFTSDDPEVNLSGVIEPNRNAKQKQLIDDLVEKLRPAYSASQEDDLIFDPSPDWAYTILQVDRPQQGRMRRGANPLGNRPSQPKKSQPAAEIAAETTYATLAADLVLFNVLVALEWTPTEDYMRGLEWAFRRASDYLYDVTDGKMAFGQVIFAGAEWMECADIQIMASNRFHPRSWVNGLHIPEKYLPIRVGRGYWFQRSRVSIPWDEPEAYRVLVHEWAHYALNQKDAYLQPMGLQAAREIGFDKRNIALIQLPESILIPKGSNTTPIYHVVVQRVRESSDSIMATTLGTSELVPHAGGGLRTRKESEWAKIHNIPAFEKLAEPDPPLEGPGRLPLPLPQFVHFAATAAEAPLFPALNPASTSTNQPSAKTASTLEDTRPTDIPPHQCWIYVIRDLDTERPSLIAQGTLDAQSIDDGFRLLGALAGDTVVLVAKCTLDEAYPCGKDRVLVQQITQDNELPNDGWADATPDGMPLMNIQPCPLAAHTPDDQLAQVRLNFTGDASKLPDAVWIFPLAQAPFDPLYPDAKLDTFAAPLSVPTLDGHVLTSWGSGKDRKLMITSFSQGGCPPSGGAFAPVPITAGSSDGRVMLFFHDPDQQDNGDVPQVIVDRRKAYSRIKVVTTSNNGITGNLPHPGARPASYLFSLASNNALPAECYPTLAIHHDTLNEIAVLTGHLMIYRLDVSSGSWQPQPTYNQVGANVVVTPLTAAVAPELAWSRTSPPELAVDLTTPQYYQLFWIPRDG